MTDDLVNRLHDYINCRPWAEGRTFDETHPEVLIAQSAERIDDLEYITKQDLRRLEEQNKYIEELLNVLRYVEPVLVVDAMINPRDKRTKRTLHLVQATLLKADAEQSGEENG